VGGGLGAVDEADEEGRLPEDDGVGARRKAVDASVSSRCGGAGRDALSLYHLRKQSS
jgi:hypothetical protein